MELGKYFNKSEGIGVLATASECGDVDCAIYAKPHIINNSTVAFIMADHLSHQYVSRNPKAVYMFIEKGKGYHGLRMYLEKIDEKSDPELIESMRRREPEEKMTKEWLVYFKIDHVRELTGDKTID